MPKLNENYLNVQDSYLFAEIARRVKVYEENHPDKAGNIIRLGIGDVTRPLTKSAVEALHKAVDEQAGPWRIIMEETAWRLTRTMCSSLTEQRATPVILQSFSQRTM